MFQVVYLGYCQTTVKEECDDRDGHDGDILSFSKGVFARHPQSLPNLLQEWQHEDRPHRHVRSPRWPPPGRLRVGGQVAQNDWRRQLSAGEAQTIQGPAPADERKWPKMCRRITPIDT